MEQEIIIAILAAASTIVAASIGAYAVVKSRNEKHDDIPDNSGVHDKYIGHYECFHLGIVDQSKIIQSSVRINKNEESRLEVVMESTEFKYVGDISILHGNLYISLRGDLHAENMQVILNAALSRAFDLLVGVFSAITPNSVPVAGRMLWRKVVTPSPCRVISLKQAPVKIRNFLVMEGNPIIVNQPSEPFFDKWPG